MEAVCYGIPLSRPNLCGTNSRELEDLTSFPVMHGIACRSGYDPKREAWGYIGLRSSSVLFEETSELLFFFDSVRRTDDRRILLLDKLTEAVVYIE